MTVQWPNRRHRRVGWALLVLLLMSACDKTASVDPSGELGFSDMSISEHELPTLWALGSDSYHRVSLELKVPDDVRSAILAGDIPEPEVTLMLDDMGEVNNMLVVQLFDDGSTTDLAELDGNNVDTSYAARSSGDLVPNDFKFSVLINSRFTATAGTFWAILDASILDPDGGGNRDFAPDLLFSDFIDDSVVVTSNSAPTLNPAAGMLPDSLYSGFESTLWSIGASDPDEAAGDSVTSVDLELFAGVASLRQLIFTLADGGIWTLQADSSFTAGLATGEITFHITATDLFGQVSAPLDTTVWVENGAPSLSDPDMPDTVYVPSGSDPNLYTLSVAVHDPQSQLDIERVYYEVIDPTDVHSSNPDWVLTDSGEDPDPVAQDGVWSAGIRTEAGNTNLGTYHFLFFAEDRGGNLSDTLDVPIVMVSE